MLGCEITGIILAGGESKRFGKNKSLFELDGIRLIDRVLNILTSVSGTILISTNNPEIQIPGYRVVRDIEKGKGPMMGIYSALLQSTTQHNFVLSVDTPLVPAFLFEYMFLAREMNQVVVPMAGVGKFEPLIGYYNRDCLPAMKSYIEQGKLKLPDFFNTIPFLGIDVHSIWPDWDDRFFLNINTQQDISGFYTVK